MKYRIESIDWLRGLMAISIMLYHLTIWLFCGLDSGDFLGRFGIYGVSIFFILSGLSMAIVYSSFIANVRSSIVFYLRRAFRIWPLLWICIPLALLPNVINHIPIGFFNVIANMTTTFGFFKPQAYINIGAWSIGNEMVYYALTPIIIMIYNRKKLWGDLFTLSTFGVFCLFAFKLISPSESLADQWVMYINPFNNLFLYTLGISMYYNFRSIQFSPLVCVILFCFSVAFFGLFPIEGDLAKIVTGLPRLLFVLFSAVLVVSFYKFTDFSLIPKVVRKALEQFGLATYGVYLLHSIAWVYLTYLFKWLGIENNYLLFTAAVIVAIAGAVFSYHVYEKRMIDVGRVFTNKIAK